ncbi:MAG: hypothetical protein WEE89_08035 [Gemmatimonadota bacterium]
MPTEMSFVADRTVEAYVQAVARLARFYNTFPAVRFMVTRVDAPSQYQWLSGAHARRDAEAGNCHILHIFTALH